MHRVGDDPHSAVRLDPPGLPERLAFDVRRQRQRHIHQHRVVRRQDVHAQIPGDAPLDILVATDIRLPGNDARFAVYVHVVCRYAIGRSRGPAGRGLGDVRIAHTQQAGVFINPAVAHLRADDDRVRVRRRVIIIDDGVDHLRPGGRIHVRMEPAARFRSRVFDQGAVANGESPGSFHAAAVRTRLIHVFVSGDEAIAQEWPCMGSRIVTGYAHTRPFAVGPVVENAAVADLAAVAQHDPGAGVARIVANLRMGQPRRPQQQRPIVQLHKNAATAIADDHAIADLAGTVHVHAASIEVHARILCKAVGDGESAERRAHAQIHAAHRVVSTGPLALDDRSLRAAGADNRDRLVGHHSVIGTATRRLHTSAVVHAVGHQHDVAIERRIHRVLNVRGRRRPRIVWRNGIS